MVKALRAFFYFMVCSNLMALEFDDLLKDFKGNDLGVSIVSLDSALPIFSFQDTKLLLPNSILKAVTSYLSIQQLGEEFRFSTRSFITGRIEHHTLKGDLIIVGGADPTLGSKRFKDPDAFLLSIYHALAAKEIKVIEGSIVIESGVFDDICNHPDWLDEDIANYYGCGVHSLNYLENTYNVSFSLGSPGSQPRITSIEPDVPDLKVENKTVTAQDHIGDQAGILYNGSHENVVISGKLGAKSKNITIKGAIPFPEKVLKLQLLKLLKDNKIKVLGKKVQDTKRSFLTSFESPKLLEMLHIMNQASINLYAEAFFKSFSALPNKQGSFTGSMHIAQQALHKMGITSCIIKDGSGLSELNRVTCLAMTSFLAQAWSSPHKQKFMSTLASTSLHDTSRLKGRFPGSKYENAIWGKTGSSSKGRSALGYLQSSQGKMYCFCVIENGFSAASSQLLWSRLNLVFDSLID